MLLILILLAAFTGTLVFASLAANVYQIHDWLSDLHHERDRLRRDRAYHRLLTPRQTRSLT